MSYNSPFSGAEVDDAVAKRHEKNKDTKLDEGGANEVTATDARAHIDSTANPHGVTKTQVGLGDVDNVSAADLRDRSTHTGTQDATTVDYENASSGLAATDVQNAIDEVASFGAGATGGGDDEVFIQNDQVVTADYTIPADKNALTTGPVTIDDGVTITVSSGSRWVVLV